MGVQRAVELVSPVPLAQSMLPICQQAVMLVPAIYQPTAATLVTEEILGTENRVMDLPLVTKSTIWRRSGDLSLLVLGIRWVGQSDDTGFWGMGIRRSFGIGFRLAICQRRDSSFSAFFVLCSSWHCKRALVGIHGLIICMNSSILC